MDLVTLALAKSYINKRINEEGVVTGATPQQAAQIGQNKTDIAALQVEVEDKQPKGNYVRSVNGIEADENGNVEVSAGVDVSSAQVGQMIVVKTVDENGKPTEWETVDKPAYIANVRIDRGRYSFVDGNHETLLNAYNNGAIVGLNANGYMYYLFKVVDDNLYFGQIPYTDSDSEIAEIPNYYLMVAPDNSITQTIRDIATVGFVNQAIAESMPTQVQADFAQNDETGPDYIKGRTHWCEPGEEVLPPIVISAADVEPDSPKHGKFALPGVTFPNPDVGEVYTVVFNGVTYATKVVSTYGPPRIIGNKSYFTGVSSDDTGEPFLIWFGTDGSCGDLWPAWPVSEDIVIAIYDGDKAPKYVPLDERFIPDSIARKTDVAASLEVNLEHYSDTLYFYTPTYDEIRVAHLKGQRVFMRLNDVELVLLTCTDQLAQFIGLAGDRIYRGSVSANNTLCSVWYKEM